MKFDNDDAYRLARDYMRLSDHQVSEERYLTRFIEVYNKYDEWLSADDPLAAIKATQKGISINPLLKDLPPGSHN